MPKKSFEFVLSKRDNIIIFNLDFILLPTEVDFILEKKGNKEDVLEAHKTGRIKTIFALSTKVVALHVKVNII